MPRRLGLLAGLTTATLLVGCSGVAPTPSPGPSTAFPSPGPTSAAAATASPYWVPSGFQLYTIAEDGFRIAMPSPWKVIQPTQASIDEMLTAISETSPNSPTGQLDQIRSVLRAPSLRLFGADLPSLPSRGVSTYVSVVIVAGSTVTAEQAMTAMASGAKIQGGENISEHLIVLRPGKAAVVEYDAPNALIAASGSGEAAHIARWWLPSGGKAYQVTGITTGSTDDISTLLTVGTSFDLIGGTSAPTPSSSPTSSPSPTPFDPGLEAALPAEIAGVPTTRSSGPASNLTGGDVCWGFMCPDEVASFIEALGPAGADLHVGIALPERGVVVIVIDFRAPGLSGRELMDTRIAALGLGPSHDSWCPVAAAGKSVTWAFYSVYLGLYHTEYLYAVGDTLYVIRWDAPSDPTNLPKSCESLWPTPPEVIAALEALP